MPENLTVIKFSFVKTVHLLPERPPALATLIKVYLVDGIPVEKAEYVFGKDEALDAIETILWRIKNWRIFYEEMYRDLEKGANRKTSWIEWHNLYKEILSNRPYQLLDIMIDKKLSKVFTSEPPIVFASAIIEAIQKIELEYENLRNHFKELKN